MGNFLSNAQQEEDIANDEALFNACEYGDEDALAALLRDTIANVNHVDREQDGATPLIVAAAEGHAGCLRQLAAAAQRPVGHRAETRKRHWLHGPEPGRHGSAEALTAAFASQT